MAFPRTAGVLTIVTLAIGAAAAQDNTAAGAGFRTFISDIVPPGIDNGLRDNDPPRPPRPYPTDLKVRDDGTPYLRGSIIVKFRPGTAASAQRLMVTRVGASTMELKKKAIENGMITLRRSGLRKVMSGLTSIEEVVRETVK